MGQHGNAHPQQLPGPSILSDPAAGLQNHRGPQNTETTSVRAPDMNYTDPSSMGIVSHNVQQGSLSNPDGTWLTQVHVPPDFNTTTAREILQVSLGEVAATYWLQ